MLSSPSQIKKIYYTPLESILMPLWYYQKEDKYSKNKVAHGTNIEHWEKKEEEWEETLEKIQSMHDWFKISNTIFIKKN